jgi:hypothetical protein
MKNNKAVVKKTGLKMTEKEEKNLHDCALDFGLEFEDFKLVLGGVFYALQMAEEGTLPAKADMKKILSINFALLNDNLKGAFDKLLEAWRPCRRFI